MTLAYARNLAEARACLAGLADMSQYETSIEYVRTPPTGTRRDACGHGPASFPVTGSLSERHRRVEARLEDLSYLGADPLRIELILAASDEIRPPADGWNPG